MHKNHGYVKALQCYVYRTLGSFKTVSTLISTTLRSFLYSEFASFSFIL